MDRIKKVELTARQLQVQRARERGLCPICCKREPPEGRKCCSVCTSHSAEWQKRNRREVCERNRKARNEILRAYGHKCACCGEVRREFLAIDHVAGGGAQERKTIQGRQLLSKIKRLGFPDTYRLLCHNCNLARGFYGYCPHEREVETSNEIHDLTVEPFYE